MTSVPSRRSLAAALLTLVGFAASCTTGPSGPGLPTLEAVVGGGDGQYGTVGELLPAPLRVVIRSVPELEGEEDVNVVWQVEEGDAAVEGSATTVTDSTGASEVRLRLGSTPGPVVLRATVTAQQSATITFQAFTVERPILDSLSVTSAGAADTITLFGGNFSPTAEQNVVLLSGVRAQVVSASAAQLRIEIPGCIPPQQVRVSVQLGVVASDTLTLSATGGGSPTSLAIGEALDVADDAGFVCLKLPETVGERYYAVVHATSTVGAATYPFQFTGLASEATPLSPPAAAPAIEISAEDQLGLAQVEFETYLRSIEAGLAPSAGRSSGGGPARAPAAAPAVGDKRTFSVFESAGEFDQVTATARYVSQQAVLYVDNAAPSGGFTDADLQAFAQSFDDVIHPTVTGVFGATSDLDGNDRVVILFTAAVNRLTPAGTEGFVGGFFFSVDLIEGSEGSNGGEVFYSVVPDPQGEFGDPRLTQDVLAVVPTILAHEFQHMVHYNERVLQLQAANNEALWLSEGLAQMAEEVVARAYEDLGDTQSADKLRSSNRIRGRLYLQRPDSVSLIVAAGRGTLAERGAGFLHVLYLVAQDGTDILTRLTQTTRTGVANVEAQFGTSWSELLANWWTAVAMDPFLPDPSPLVYPNLDFRDFMRALPGDSFPLRREVQGFADFTSDGTLVSASVRFYVLLPPAGGSVSVRLGGEAGGVSSSDAELRLRIVRYR